MQKKLSDLYGLHILKDLVWQDKVASFYDPVTSLPAVPTFKDRYISSSTNNGWIENNIYEYDGDNWFESEPSVGFVTYVVDEDITYYFDGSTWDKWIDIASTEKAGLVKVGDGLGIDPDGTLNVTNLAGGPATYVSIQSNQTDTTINHNLNAPYVYVQVYDDTNEMIKPDTVEMVNDNSVRLVFSEPTSFLCIITEAGISHDSILSFINFKGRWTGLAGELYLPASTYHNGQFWILLENLADVTTEEPTQLSTVWRSAQGEVSGYFTGDYTTDEVTITHGLNNTNVIVQTKNTSTGQVIFPQYIEIIDNNNVKVTFSQVTSFTVTIK